MQSMITTQLLRPQSIVVVGASNNTHKPGGAILKNLINGGYQGELRAVNPKENRSTMIPSSAHKFISPSSTMVGKKNEIGTH